MDRLNAHDHLLRVESDAIGHQHTQIIQQRAQVTARNILHGEIQTVFILEGVVEVDEPRRVEAVREDVPLILDVRRFVAQLQDFLRHLFECQDLAGVTLSDEEDLTKSTGSDER